MTGIMRARPWRLFYEGSGDFLILDADNVEIASVSRPDAHFMGTGEGADINEARARLIAAAPHLLDVMKRIAADYKGAGSAEQAGENLSDVMPDVLAAIAEAEPS